MRGARRVRRASALALTLTAVMWCGAAWAQSGEAARPAAASPTGEVKPDVLPLLRPLSRVEPFAIDVDRDRPRGAKLDFNAEYRVRSIYINPLDLSGEEVRDMNWTEQRLRLNTVWQQPGVGRIVMQADVLDAVLFGDNGRFGGDPSSNSGVSISSKRPNLTRWDVGIRDNEADPLSSDNYVPVLRPADTLKVNYLYADVNLPVGLLRIGRQPISYGKGLAAHEGTRVNRWGVSQFADGVDRILFGTKLNEAVNLVRDRNHKPDLTERNGLIFAMFYDLMKQDKVYSFSDNVRQMGVAIDFRKERGELFGLDWKNVVIGQRLVNLSNDRYNTNAFGLPFVFDATVEDRLRLQVQYIHLNGSTREIAEGFAALTGAEVQQQKIRAHGLHMLADLELGPVVLSLEFNYASGDADPRPDNAITSFSFARDTNVGLLMFERIIAFESARSVAIGKENLASLDLEGFPLTEAQTDGRFTNAMALFPQVYVALIRRPENEMWLRGGALFAWPAADGVVDPVQTALNADGDTITDDAVNWHGGKPGSYYGTELDLQWGWRFKKHFEWSVEGAVLFPGDSLRDENGDAVNAFMLENRFTFMF